MSSRKLTYSICFAFIGAASVFYAPPDIADDSQTESAEEIVARRALERWNLMIDGRFEGAYAYLPPGYRATHTVGQYSRTISGGLWKKAEVKSVKCQAGRCEAKVILDMLLGGKGNQPVPIWLEDTWIQTEQGGEWWYIPPT